MPKLQVVLDASLLKALVGAARRMKINRSEVMREALREYLRGLTVRERERQDREGYERHRENVEDIAVWEKVASRPQG
jgi:metal-responsive CopG/Arc/MetJ family transcriptional regulator